MARPKNVVPPYKHHKPSNTARCWVGGAWVSLGRYGSPESRAEYERVCAQLRTAGPPPASAGPGAARPAASAVNEILLAFWRHADQHYRRADGSATKEVKEFKAALRPVRELFGHRPAAEFGPVALQAVRRR